MYKRYISLFCVFLLILSSFCACSKQEDTDETDTAQKASNILTESKLFINGFEQDSSSDVPVEVAGFDSPKAALEYFKKDDHIPSWDVLWLVVGGIDADAADAAGNPIHRTLSLSENEKNYLLNDMPFIFADTVNKMTNGELVLEVHPKLYDNPVTFLDEKNSVSVRSFDAETRESFREYDSVIVTFRPDIDNEEQPVAVELPGTAYGIQDYKYGFCTIPVASSLMYQKSAENPNPEIRWIYEWIKTLMPLTKAFGSEIPSPDSAADYGYTEEALRARAETPAEVSDTQENAAQQSAPAPVPAETPTFAFCRDILSANVTYTSQDGPAKLGITPALWKTIAYTLDTVKL
ncbi:MAG: hypothetical protein K6F52_03360 [Clostridia bacterium]|nr:hypothetical protein [Clostridia bacterium]